VHAVVLSAFGGPEALVPGEHPDPIAGDGEVVVELQAAALNWHDCLVRNGQYPRVPLPHVLGADGAGRRRDDGAPVIILPSLWWGDDEGAPGADWEILGDYSDGTYAELVTVPAQNLRPVPAGWTAVEAAALPLAGLTAFRALFSRGGLQRGETVLVLGAGGGVATVAMALARMAGARVLCTTSSEAKLAAACDGDADAGVLYTGDAWPDHVRELTGGAGVDLVIDSVGSTIEAALQTLRGGGRLVTFGATGAARTEIDVRRLYFGQWSILGTTMGSPRDFDGLLALLGEDPAWRPHVDRTFALDDAAAAHAAMERREHTGKLVLEIS
jgi:NADPH:quinone reductase-like Zn-dependent oxidoreductase